MSFFVYVKLKPGSSDSGKLEETYLELDDQCFPKEIAENFYFLGDGHSSHSLVIESDQKAKSVRLAPVAIAMIRNFHREGRFPSFVVRYETDIPINDINSKNRIGMNVSDLNSEFWFVEDQRYFFHRES